MDKINFDILLKNIPIPNKLEYFQKLVLKTEDLMRRMKWKVYFFINGRKADNTKDNYGFKNCSPAPHIEKLVNFEKDLYGIINNITFQYKKSRFQKHLDELVWNISKSEQVFVKLDKTSNFYKMKSDEYNTLIKKTLMNNYKKIKY